MLNLETEGVPGDFLSATVSVEVAQRSGSKVVSSNLFVS